MNIDQKIRKLLAESGELAIEREPAFAAESCESPIERLLMLALWSRGVWTNRAVMLGNALGFEHIDAAVSKRLPGQIVIIQQANVGSYRLDFLASAKLLSSMPRMYVGIECDGHDYHERTKEQAQRDKSRDRELTARGIKMLRFTGSEIWADPGACAEEIFGLFDSAYVDVFFKTEGYDVRAGVRP